MWIYEPSTHYHSAQGMEGLNSESISPPKAEIKLLLMLSGKPTHRQLSWRGWKNRPWIKLLYGTILQPSMASRGVEKWISSLPDSHVNHGPLPADKRVLKMIDGYGKISSELFAKYDQATSSWKTSQASLMEDSNTYSDRWPKWGSMQSGVVSKRQMSEQLTKGKEYSFWRTPMASDGMGGIMEMREGANVRLKLRDHAANWKTPTARDRKGDSHKGKIQRLPYQATNWTESATTSLPDQIQNCGEDCSVRDRRLNPMFVEYMMGILPNWSVPTVQTD